VLTVRLTLSAMADDPYYRNKIDDTVRPRYYAPLYYADLCYARIFFQKVGTPNYFLSLSPIVDAMSVLQVCRILKKSHYNDRITN
jgi:hypothetical protein